MRKIEKIELNGRTYIDFEAYFLGVGSDGSFHISPLQPGEDEKAVTHDGGGNLLDAFKGRKGFTMRRSLRDTQPTLGHFGLPARLREGICGRAQLARLNEADARKYGVLEREFEL